MASKLTPEVIAKLFKVLQSYLDSKHEKYSITSFSVSPGSNQNDNYLSSIYSVKFSKVVNGQMSDHDLIFKSQMISNAKFEDGSEYFWAAIFMKEQMAYSSVVGKMEALSGCSLAPEMHHFYNENESYCCILLDNLISQGYYIPKTRGGGLTLEEAVLMVKGLAAFHASSLVMEGQSQKRLTEEYEFCGAEMMFSPVLESVIGSFIQNSFLGVVEAAKTIRPDLVTILTNLHQEKSVYARLCDWLKPGHALSSFSCFCHGDPRTANLFVSKSESGSPTMKFIDYQLVRYAAPVTDLHYALQLGTTKEFREKNLTALLAEYHGEFRRILTKSTVKPLNGNVETWTLEKLTEEFNNFNLFGLLIALTLLPVTFFSGNSENKNVDEMNSKERADFVHKGRLDFISRALIADEELSKRIFEACDEVKEKGAL